MNHTTMSNKIPVIVILCSNALMGLGLRSILERMLPFAAFKLCDDFSQIEHSAPEDHFHLFVEASKVVEHAPFFEARHTKTIALTSGTPNSNLLQGYHQINILAPQEQIEASLQQLHKHAHTPAASPIKEQTTKEVLSPREIEVLKLLVEGLMNKEIADRLNIGITTVITHRKNIVEKLGVKSVAGLTIYAVMKRYITI